MESVAFLKRLCPCIYCSPISREENGGENAMLPMAYHQSIPEAVPLHDDVECCFSILRDTVRKDFTLKEVQYAWRRVKCQND